MSIFTPQRGANPVESLSQDERQSAVYALLELRNQFPKLDMPEGMLKALLAPPESPAKCIFARTTRTISADFKTHVEPCQFGGDPDCSRCGCIASMGSGAIGNHRLIGPLTAGHLFWASASLGDAVQQLVNPEKSGSKTTSKDEPAEISLTSIQPILSDRER